MKNRVEIEGRLRADATTASATGTKKVTRFTLAISKTWKKDGEIHKRVDWVRVSCWEAGVIATAKDFKKGDLVEVVGELRTGQYESAGVAHNSCEVRAKAVKVVAPHKQHNCTENVLTDEKTDTQDAETQDDNSDSEGEDYQTLPFKDHNRPAA
jgi:single stranded DNA-binding protein